MRYDVIIAGGGPAGLSAALLLGRCRRKVIVVDAGNPRNARSQGMHGFLSRDGMYPGEFLVLAREEVKSYGVEICEGTVMKVEDCDAPFRVHLLDETVLESRKVLLATGVVDRVPNLDGIDQFYGKTVHHCPYCDGWEHSDQPIAVYGKGTGGTALSLAMLTWSRDVILCTDGASRLSSEERAQLARHAVDIHEKKIKRLEGDGTRLASIIFDDGTSINRSALFFSTSNVQRSTLPDSIGCSRTHKGAVRTNKRQQTNVTGIYVAGDACDDTQFVIVAAAEGAKAAMAINAELQQEEQSETSSTFQ